MDLADVVTAYSSATVHKDIRDFFLQERERLGLTQVDVANAGGVDQSTISKIESDVPYNPRIDVFIRAVRGLGMTPSNFFAKFETHKTGGEPNERAGLPKQGLLTSALKPHDPPLPISKVADHGASSLSAPAAISEEDLRAFFRILQHALGGSIFAAIEKAQQRPRRQTSDAAQRKARLRKGARGAR